MMSDQQNRRKFLQTIGASSIATATVGVGAGRQDRTSSSNPEVHFSVPDLSPCSKHCYGADYVIPLGATIDFEASYSGDGNLAKINKTHRKSDETETVSECQMPKGDSVEGLDHGHDGWLGACRTVPIEFRETGKFDIEVEYWSRDGIIGTLDHGHDDEDETDDCEAFESLDCETITVRVVRPEPTLEVIEPKQLPATVDERVIFQSGIGNLYFDYDLIDDWRLETKKVPDELLPEPPGAPEDGQLFARLPTETGTYIAVAVAEIGDFEFTSNQLSFDVEDKHEPSLDDEHAKVSVHSLYAKGEVTLVNNTHEDLTATLKLKAVRAHDSLLLEKEREEVSAGDREDVSLFEVESDLDEYDEVVLTLDGEVIASKPT
jgi:hypothetical protein